MKDKASKNGRVWLATAPVDEVVSGFRALMLEDFERAKCIFEGITKAANDPVLSTLAMMSIEDELNSEEVEREVAEALKASKSEERISAEDARYEILG